MGHVLGLGTLWISKGVLRGVGTNNPEYIGPHAMREYAALYHRQQQQQQQSASHAIQGLPGTTKPVPVANTGGPGTAEGHWREAVFDQELMTGYAEDGGTPMPLSRLTIAALEDLGYQVDYNQADPYTLPTTTTTTATANGSYLGANNKKKCYCKSRFPTLQTQPTPPKRRFQRVAYGCCGACALLIVIIVILIFALGVDCDHNVTESILDPIGLYDRLC